MQSDFILARQNSDEYHLLHVTAEGVASYGSGFQRFYCGKITLSISWITPLSAITSL